MKRLFGAIVVAALLGGTPAAKAGLETFDFTVTATTGPLAGATSTGSFSFDTAIIPTGGGSGNVIRDGLLSSLTFTWNGIAYTAATANTHALMFDATGALVGALFGNNCNSSGCIIVPGFDDWAVGWLGGGTFSSFEYSTPDSRFFEQGTLVISPATAVPEPGTLAVMGAGLAAMAFLRRRAKQ
jgi:hypothetical protein